MSFKEKIKLDFEYAGLSDIGTLRSENQDTLGKFPEESNDIYQSKGILFIIADGMGGHERGKEASLMAIHSVSEAYRFSTLKNIPECLYKAFESANDKVFNYSKDKLLSQRMGTTCTALVVQGNRAFIAHIGDSRIYSITNDNIEQITHDHTAVDEMYRKGILSKEEAKTYPNKSMLVRAIGVEPKIDVEINDKISIKSGDYFVLCSDGMSQIKKNEIKNIVLSNSQKEACKILINLAKEKGSTDNITVQVIKIKNADTGPYYIPGDQNEKSLLKWVGFGILGLLSIIIFVYLLISIFKTSESDLNDISTKTIKKESTGNGFHENDLVIDDDEFIRAQAIYNMGNFDSALALYQEMLKTHPMQLEVINKVNLIYNNFVDQGDQFLLKNDINGAFNFYKKAGKIKPDNENIISMIEYCEKKMESEQTELNENSMLIHDEVSTEDNNYTDALSLVEKNISPIYQPSSWFLGDLRETDYNFSPSSIILYETSSLKKIVYNKHFIDVDIDVVIYFPDEKIIGEAGLIVGYNSEDGIQNESFFLVTLNKENIISLKEFSEGIAKQLFSIVTDEQNNTGSTKLKIRCLGPWIMIYINQNLLKAWLNEKLVRGKIGLFVDPNMHANFTRFKISPAINIKK